MSPSKSDPLAGRIFIVRDQRVMLDADLARLYGVKTKRLNEAVNRNVRKFPEDFRFQLTRVETANLRSQFATSSMEPSGKQKDAMMRSQNSMTSFSQGGRRTYPWAFTEHGCLMAATVLNSPRAVRMSVYVIRAFVRMREELTANSMILKRLAEIDKSLLEHDSALRTLWQRLQPLLAPPSELPRRRIGFHPGKG